MSTSEKHNAPRGLILAVIGTDTEIGKTIVAAGLARSLARLGVKAGVFKPFASGAVRRGRGAPFSEDADLLVRAAFGAANSRTKSAGVKGLRAQRGFRESRAEATGELFRAPLAPLAAAQAEGRRVDIAAVLRKTLAVARMYDLTIVEGCGGWNVPITARLTTADYFERLGAPVLIVGRAGLGTINHCLLTLEAVRARRLRTVGFILNRALAEKAGKAEAGNPEMLRRFSGLPVWGPLPHRPSLARPRLHLVDERQLHDLRDEAGEIVRLLTRIDGEA